MGNVRLCDYTLFHSTVVVCAFLWWPQGGDTDLSKTSHTNPVLHGIKLSHPIESVVWGGRQTENPKYLNPAEMNTNLCLWASPGRHGDTWMSTWKLFIDFQSEEKDTLWCLSPVAQWDVWKSLALSQNWGIILSHT